MSCRWNEETTVKFVEAYRDRECLWNTTKSIYKNKQARNAAYKEIEEIMHTEGFGISEIKNKIRALRSTYAQEKKKIKDSKKSGASSDSVYVPNIKWFALMDAFLQCLEESKRPTQDNLIQDVTVNEMPNAVGAYEDLTSPPPPKRFSKVQHVSSIVSELKKISENVSENAPKENEYEIFGRGVAAQLMALSKLNGIKAQDKIQSVLTSFKLEELTQNQPISYVGTPSISPDVYTDSSNTTTFLNSPHSVNAEDQYDHSDIIHRAFINM